MAAARLEGSSPTSPSRHLTDAGAPPGIAGDLVDSFLQVGLPPSIRLPPHTPWKPQYLLIFHSHRPSEVYLFLSAASPGTQVLILRGKNNFLTGIHSSSPIASPLVSQHSDAFSLLWAGKVQSHVLPHALVISERASWSVSHSKRKR